MLERKLQLLNPCGEPWFARLCLERIKRPAALLKKRLWHRCFPVNFAKFLRTPVSQNTSG